MALPYPNDIALSGLFWGVDYRELPNPDDIALSGLFLGFGVYYCNLY
jgi:hypothetical protein